jgi:hypothetical protein
MFDINQIYKIDNFLSNDEIEGFQTITDKYKWEHDGFSHKQTRIFWIKELLKVTGVPPAEPIETTFREKIEYLFNVKLQTERMYLNGQSHGQCGSFHTDVEVDADGEYMTLIYYANKTWDAEKGGFTIIVDNQQNMHIVYPKPNSIVCFNSKFAHVGLEPTVHCVDLRVTMAQKFKVLK